MVPVFASKHLDALLSKAAASGVKAPERVHCLIMNAFEEYQRAAAKVPVSLRNNRDRVELPVLGLQEEAGKLDRYLRLRLQPANSPDARAKQGS